MAKPKLLIEQWLPIEAIGAECMRERGASSALPPLYFLHVWWARRPLTVSRAAILASLLPFGACFYHRPERARGHDLLHNWLTATRSRSRVTQPAMKAAPLCFDSGR